MNTFQKEVWVLFFTHTHTHNQKHNYVHRADTHVGVICHHLSWRGQARANGRTLFVC